MTERPRFDPVKPNEHVPPEAFNELVHMYNELADAYEDLFVKDRMRTEVVQMLDFQTVAIIDSLAEGHDMKVKEIGYDQYKKQTLSGERQLKESSPFK